MITALTEPLFAVCILGPVVLAAAVLGVQWIISAIRR